MLTINNLSIHELQTLMQFTDIQIKAYSKDKSDRGIQAVKELTAIKTKLQENHTRYMFQDK